MQMQYFRRPQLTGENFPRLRYATVRGTVRRSDADGISAVPYFPGVTAGMTLDITITSPPDASPSVSSVTVNLTGGDLQTIINDINTAIGVAGKAVDDGGALAIKTDVQGGLGYVQVTGGTAAVLLGFNTIGSTLRSNGGDLPSAPEARIGNPWDTSFPVRGEGLGTDTIQRALARISANTDVSFSDLSRQNAQLQRVASFSVGTGGQYLTPAATTRIFTGGPSASNPAAELSAASSKEDLAPYFFIYDTVTKQPAASRVVGVTRGTPAGDPPYANATTWSGLGSSGNVLGVDLVKQSGNGIVSIREGRIVELAVAIHADVVEGDLVEVVGATNIFPWVNNGLRWVLEKKIDSTHMIVRPMSSSELAQMGQNFSDVHPIVELNGEKEITQTFGTVSFHTGYATTNVNLTVRPPIPTGAVYEVWACQPLSDREAATWVKPLSVTPQSLAPQNDLDTSKNSILSRPTQSSDDPGAGQITVSGYYVRWHGRTCYVPPSVMDVPDNASGYIYWDERTCQTSYVVATTTSVFNGEQDPNPTASAAAAVGTKGIPLFIFVDSAGSIDQCYDVTRVEGTGSHVVTVGWGGDFPDISTAFWFINSMRRAGGETTTQNGTYPHFELVLLSDTNMSDVGSTEVFVNGPSNVVIRGVSPGIRLFFNGSTGFNVETTAGYSLTLKDLTVVVNTSPIYLASGGCSNLTLQNVKQDMSGSFKPFKALIQTTGTPCKLIISDCELSAAGGLIWGGTGHDVRLRNLRLSYAALAGVTSSQIFSSSSVGPSNSATSLARFSADDCLFTGYPALNTYALFVNDNSSGRYDFNNCYFSFDAATPPVVGSKLISYSSNYLTMVGCVVDGTSGTAVIGTVLESFGSVDGHIESCKFDVRPQGTLSTYGAQVETAVGCIITCVDSSVGNQNGVALKCRAAAIGNSISGPVRVGIDVGGGSIGSIASGNRVNLTAGTNTPTLVAGIALNDNNARAIGNNVSSPNGNGIRCASAGLTHIVVASNTISYSGSATAIYLNNPKYSSVTGNILRNTTAGSSFGIYIDDPISVTVGDNVIEAQTGGSSLAGTGIIATSAGAGRSMTVSGNYVFALTALNIATTIVSTITSNRLDSSACPAILGEFHSNYCTGSWAFEDNSNVVGNTFETSIAGDGGIGISTPTSGSFLNFADNAVNSSDAGDGLVVSAAHVGSKISIKGNRFKFDVLVVTPNALVISDNIFESLLTVQNLIGSTGTAEITGNVVTGAASFTSNTSGFFVLSGNAFNTSLSITASPTSRGTVVGNRVVSLAVTAPATGDAKVSITGNTVTTSLVLTSDPTSVARFEFVGNRVNGTCTLDAAAGNVILSNNTLEANPSLTKVQATSNYIAGNVTLSGTSTFSNNQVTGTLTSTGSGITLSITNNTISSTVSITANGTSSLTFSNNIAASGVTILGGAALTTQMHSNIVGGILDVNSSTGPVTLVGNESTGSFSVISGSELTFDGNVCRGSGPDVGTIVSLVKAIISNSFIYVTPAITSPLLSISGCRFSGSSYSIGDNASYQAKVDIADCSFDANSTLTLKGDINISGLRSAGAISVPSPSGGFHNLFRATNVNAGSTLTISSTQVCKIEGMDTGGAVSITLENHASSRPIFLTDVNVAPASPAALTISTTSFGVNLTGVRAGTTSITTSTSSDFDAFVVGCSLGDTTISPTASSLQVSLSDSKFGNLLLSTAEARITGCRFTALQDASGGSFDAKALVSNCSFTSVDIGSGNEMRFNNCILSSSVTISGSSCNVHFVGCTMTGVTINVACTDARFSLKGCKLGVLDSQGNIRSGLIDSCVFSAVGTCMYIEQVDKTGSDETDPPGSFVVSNSIFNCKGDSSTVSLCIALGDDTAKFIRGATFANNHFRMIKHTNNTYWACVSSTGGCRLQECQFVGNRWEKTQGAGGIFGDFTGGTADTSTTANRNVLFSGNLGFDVNSSGQFIDFGGGGGGSAYDQQEYTPTFGAIFHAMAGAHLLMASSDAGFGHQANWQFTV